MDKPVVEVQTEINADAKAVWSAMTRKKSPMFMGATMDTDWSPGSDYTLHGEFNGKAFTDYGEIETAEPSKELSFTHWSKTKERPESYNLVRYRLEPDGKRTKVTLAQFGRGKQQDFDDKAKAEFKKNWTMMLDGLKSAAEGN
jgi:uncharacterized protein YndB with AHSA1/START domain